MLCWVMLDALHHHHHHHPLSVSLTPHTSHFHFILCQLFPHLNHVFIFTLRFSLYLCCTVISTEPYIITGHLGAAGRDEPSAGQMTKCTMGGHTLTCMHPHTLLSHTLNSYKSLQGRSLPSDIARPYSRTYTPFKQSTAV